MVRWQLRGNREMSDPIIDLANEIMSREHIDFERCCVERAVLQADFNHLQSHPLAPRFHHLKQTIEALGGGVEFTAALNEVSTLFDAVEAEINRLTYGLDAANGKR